MASADETEAPAVESGGVRARGRLRRMFAGSRDLVRIVYRDPEHVTERLTLYTVDRLAVASTEWARSVRKARVNTPPAEIVEELRIQTAQIARIDGAISGTPFLIALVPGYLTYLYEEMRMTLRTAALYGRDPTQLRTASEMLALRGVHPNAKDAEAALVTAQNAPMPDRPAHRRSLRTWVDSAYRLLVFGGFLTPAAAKPPKERAPSRLRAVLSFLLAAAIWVMTWVVPFTFMILMAWGCETHVRQLGRRTLVFYDGETASVSAAIALAARRRDRGHHKRAVLRTIGLFLSVAIPIAFVVLVNRYSNTVGFDWIVALGALVAFSLVIATVIVSSRR